MSKIKLDTNYLISNAFKKAGVDSRSRAILERRFGLREPEISTLQALGDEYGISRERVRQIEEQGLRKIRSELKHLAGVEEVMKFTEDYLRFAGGIKRHDLLVHEFYSFFRPENERTVFGNELRFIYKALEFPYFFRENELLYDFWYLEEMLYRKMYLLQRELIRRLKRVEHFEEMLTELVRQYDITEPIAVNYLSVSKKIGIGPYGDIGLVHWEEINPKTVRAKIYLELKKAGRPMHFTEIARLTKCHIATVHNELIKDKRFKLVGRGTYILKFY